MTPKLAAAVGLGVLAVALWLRLMVGREDVGQLDAVYSEASLRWSIGILGRRVDDFIKTYHRAPDALTEVGHNPWDLISYERVDLARYRLTAAGPNNAIVYDSIEPRDVFVGKSGDFLAGRSGSEP